jgi:hypothetical protein
VAGCEIWLTLLHVGVNASADIRALREERGLTQQQLATAAECSLSMVRPRDR